MTTTQGVLDDDKNLKCGVFGFVRISFRAGLGGKINAT